MPDVDLGKHYNRDEELKPGRAPRSAYEPKGSEGSERNAKTLTDPASGEPLPGAPAPNQSEVDQSDGVKRRR